MRLLGDAYTRQHSGTTARETRAAGPGGGRCRAHGGQRRGWQVPLVKRFFFITRAEPSAAVQRFIGFTQSPAGRDILVSAGHWITGD